MANPGQHFRLIFTWNLRKTIFALAVVCGLTMAALQSAQAQTFTVLHSFNGVDGNLVEAGPILDRAGNLYGTTTSGGQHDYGSVYKLSHAGSGWLFDPLYSFTLHGDGGFPGQGGLTIGPDGTLYGTAGNIFNLGPPARTCRSVMCVWRFTALYTFQGGTDGENPNGAVVFDAAGNIYGTTVSGGDHGFGTVFQATRSGGTWTETVLYSFDGPHGATPTASVILDSNGNLYGTTSAGGAHAWGTVFELTPSGSGWTEQVLYNFTNGNDGRSPAGGVIFDSAGNLYGSAQNNGQNFGGTVFKLSPSIGGNWTFTLLYSLSGRGGPGDHLTMDSAGNLYGTTYQDGIYEQGSVFELSPSSGGWIYSDLHDFTGGDDGALPIGAVALDAAGNIFGTTSQGGRGTGVIFEITR